METDRGALLWPAFTHITATCEGCNESAQFSMTVGGVYQCACGVTRGWDAQNERTTIAAGSSTNKIGTSWALQDDIPAFTLG